MPGDDAALLLDILEAARKACGFVEGMNLEQFRVSHPPSTPSFVHYGPRGRQHGLFLLSTRRSIPRCRGDSMVAMRNYLVHEYFRVDVETVWKRVHEDLPPLIERIESLVRTD